MNIFLKSALVSAVFLSAFSASLFSQATPAKKNLKMVLTETLLAQDLTYSLELPGEVVAVETAILSSTLEGPISFCPRREGDFVEDGEKLIEISRDLFKAEVEVAKASLKVAQAKLADLRAGYRPQEINKARESAKEAQKSFDYMKKEVERVETLVKNKALAAEELEKIQVKLATEKSRLSNAKNNLDMLESGLTNTTIAVQKAIVDEAQAKLTLAQARIEECQILAPFSGTITSVFVQKGDLASAKTPLLEVTNMNSQVIRCAVPEIVSNQIRVGMVTNYTVDALPENIFTGKVIRIYPKLEKQIRTRLIEIEPDAKNELVPGMFARLKINLADFPQSLSVPSEVIQFEKSGKRFVFVLSEGEIARKQLIEIGPEIDGRIIVFTGLNHGARLIVAGFEKLKDGEKVTLPGRTSSKPGAKQ